MNPSLFVTLFGGNPYLRANRAAYSAGARLWYFGRPTTGLPGYAFTNAVGDVQAVPTDVLGMALSREQPDLTGPELVTNGDNEAALCGLPNNTLVRFSTKAQSNEQAYRGTYSAKLTATAGSGTHYWYAMTVPAGSPFQLSGAVYVPTGSAAGQAIQAVDINDGSYNAQLVAAGVVDTWVPFSVKRAAKATQWICGMGNVTPAEWGTTSIYFDDLSVKLILGAAAVQSTTANKPVLTTQASGNVAAVWDATNDTMTFSLLSAGTPDVVTFTDSGIVTGYDSASTTAFVMGQTKLAGRKLYLTVAHATAIPGNVLTAARQLANHLRGTAY